MRFDMRFFVFLTTVISAVDSANILAFFFYPSISHQFVFHPVVKELSLRGHNVTFVTTNLINEPSLTNLTEIDVSVGYGVFKEFNINIFRRESTSLLSMGISSQEFMERILAIEMEVEEVKNILMKPRGAFDLVLIEALCPFFYALQHKFDAPVIALSSFGTHTFLHHTFGNPVHPVLYPDVFLGYLNPVTSLWSKLDSLYAYLVFYGMSEFHIYPRYDKIARSFFGEDMPYLREMVKNVSLIFVNVNPIFSNRRPIVPNMFEVWNIHLDRKDPIPNDLQSILDKATDGAVYFSLGTNVRFDHVQGDFKNTVLKALGQLPYMVLCKWESEDFPGKPENVILRKWFPQQSIIAHPNLKVFVTQGGLQSSEEAISNGVPMVVIPFLGDQPMNAKILKKHGMAETILPSSLTEDVLRDTILKVAGEKKYREKAEELRSVFLDQPQSGLDTIIWWCEYVIRHKGAKHLRSPSADISVYEYFMLDVFIVIFVALFVTYRVVQLISEFLVRLLRRSRREREFKVKKN